MKAQSWQHLTLGELYRAGIAKFRQARRTLQSYSPVKLDLRATRNLWSVVSPLLISPILYVLEGFRENRLLPGVVENDPHSLPLLSPTLRTSHKPWYRRTERVNQVLLQAWALGFHTYSQLIEQVRYRTGIGCSKRAIARFIKERRSCNAPS
ncbi:MAG: hypothetical protein KME35_00665 [Aphanocapsa sp. GSE-SYN-MK-11-07L]|jgi:hypothetical protein|nr:hypothetical protein [Aphanocapsa sp. GSE-SYN-MK-11-07L]